MDRHSKVLKKLEWLDDADAKFFRQLTRWIGKGCGELDLQISDDAEFEAASFKQVSDMLARRRNIPQGVLNSLASWARTDVGPGAVRAIIAAGADPNLRVPAGETGGWADLIHVLSATPVCSPVLQLLVEKGVDIEARDEFGQTPLHSAAEEESGVDGVAALIELGADIEARDKYGQTPLHCAAGSGEVGSVRLLLAAGANIAAENQWGHTPFDVAASIQTPRGAQMQKLFRRAKIFRNTKNLLETSGSEMGGPTV